MQIIAAKGALELDNLSFACYNVECRMF